MKTERSLGVAGESEHVQMPERWVAPATPLLSSVKTGAVVGPLTKMGERKQIATTHLHHEAVAGQEMIAEVFQAYVDKWETACGAV